MLIPIRSVLSTGVVPSLRDQADILESGGVGGEHRLLYLPEGQPRIALDDQLPIGALFGRLPEALVEPIGGDLLVVDPDRPAPLDRNEDLAPAVLALRGLIGRRQGLSPDMDQLIAAASQRGIAMELNANGRRLDLNDLH